MQSMLSQILRQGNPLSDLNKGLVLYLDGTYDAVNGWFVDKSGNGNHGTPYNGATTGTGVVGDGINLPGALKKWVDCGNDSSLDVTTEFSYSMWINVSATIHPDYGALIVKGGNLHGMWLYRVGGTWRLRTWLSGTTNQNIYTTEVVPFNEWVHCLFSFDEGNLAMYINGEPCTLNNNATSSPVGTDSYNLGIGDYTYSSTNLSTTMLTDEIRIYDRALTANEVKALYRLKRP